MMRGLLTYRCPKRKCQHPWSAFFENVIRDADCPRCGAKEIAPVNVEALEYEAVS